MDAIRKIEAAGPISKISQRATDLHDKGYMPWEDADELALREYGLSEDMLCEVIEDFPSVDHDGVSLMSLQDLKNFARHVLVWSPLESGRDQTIASKEAEIERLRADVKRFAMLSERAEWVRESAGGHWVIRLHGKRHTSFTQTVDALTQQSPED